MKLLPTIKRLEELFWYDGLTGDLIRRMAAGSGGRFSEGEIVGAKRPDGYLTVSIDGRQCLVHRVMSAIANSEWPHGLIDHIDGDRSNNRLINLRDVDATVNNQNRHRGAPGASGFVGVHSTNAGRWVALIKINRKVHSLGTRDTPEEAHALYILGKRMLHEGCTHWDRFLSSSADVTQ